MLSLHSQAVHSSLSYPGAPDWSMFFPKPPHSVSLIPLHLVCQSGSSLENEEGTEMSHDRGLVPPGLPNPVPVSSLQLYNLSNYFMFFQSDFHFLFLKKK